MPYRSFLRLRNQLRPARTHGFAIFALLVVSSTAGATTLVETDVVTVKVDADEAPNCPIGVHPELCPVSWETNGTPDLGDDRIDVGKRIDTAKATLRLSLLPGPMTIGADPRDVRIYHPAYSTLNHTWPTINGSRPGALSNSVSFESRPSRYYADGAWHDRNDWALLIVLYLPFPVNLSGEPLEFYTIGVLCWKERDTCQVNDPDSLSVQEDNVQPLPESVSLADPSDTDESFRRKGYEATYCDLITPRPVCDLQEVVKPEIERAAEAFEDATPTVRWGVQYNKTIVQTKHGTAPAPGGFLSDSSILYPDASERFVAPEESQHPPSPIAGAMAEYGATAANPLALSVSPAGARAPTSPATDRPEGVLFVVGVGTLLAALIWLLYHRISTSRALESPMRRRAFDLIVQEPGLRVAQISGKLSVDFNTAKYHVRMLEKFGQIAGVGLGPKRYFAAGCAELADSRIRILPTAHPPPRRFIASSG